MDMDTDDHLTIIYPSKYPQKIGSFIPYVKKTNIFIS